MVVSVLHLVLTVRALLRCVSERYVFGIVGGLARAALIVVGACIGGGGGAVVMLPGLTLTLSPSGESSLERVLGQLVLSALGPALAFAVLWASYRRFHDAPAAEEEERQRPFRAWLPVAIVDAIYVVVMVGAMAISEP